jgi:hypothetical protein
LRLVLEANTSGWHLRLALEDSTSSLVKLEVNTCCTCCTGYMLHKPLP